MRLYRPIFVLGMLSATACTSETVTTAPPVAVPPGETPTDGPTDQPAAEPDADLAPELIAERPYKSTVPSDYDGSKALPLVLALHGRGDSGPSFAKASGLIGLVDEQQMLLAYPSGEMIVGTSGWAAMSGLGGPDDVKYLRAVIADMASRYNVDRKRVVVVGLSMGAFMGNLLACRAADKIAGVLSISGSLVESQGPSCKPARPLTITLLHGTADETVPYEGGEYPIAGKYYSAPALYDFWGKTLGCGGESPVAAQDIDSAVAGAETTGTTRPCKDATNLTLLTAKDGAHVLSIRRTALASLLSKVTTVPRAN